MNKVYTVTITLKSPLHINGGISPNGNRTFIKHDNKPYIPATLFKGIVRNNFEMLVNTYNPLGGIKCNGKNNSSEPCNCISCMMFGKSGFQKSRIIFDNLEMSNKFDEFQPEIRANTSINRYLKTVKNEALVFSEIVPINDNKNNPIQFIGEISAYYPESMDIIENYLKASISLIKNIGNGKSRGLGFVEVSLNEKTR